MFPAHEPFVVNTVPISHDMCGSLTIFAKFDGQPVDGDPLLYNAATRVFSANTVDSALIGD